MAGTPASSGTGGGLTGILELPARVARLAGDARARADRLFEVQAISGATVPPATLEPWLTATFGSVAAVREQSLLRVTNLATLDAAIFAPLRARRPVDGPDRARDLAAEIAATDGDPFCDPAHATPADTFGRVRGDRMLTGANAALADAHHAVLVFDDHDPLAFDAGLVADLFTTGRAWADRARVDDPDAATYLLLWNCLWRAGGSIIHGHAQALLGAGRHHARLERFRRDADAYRARHGAELVADLQAVHRDLELAVDRDGITTLAHLTPTKERELLVIGPPGTDERDPPFADAVASALLAYRDRLGVRSFNLALWRRPLADREALTGWESFPTIAWLVDRGDPFTRPSDIGAMELYGTPIVGSDPYEAIRAIRGA
ncbi:MAG TPA: hypothetical protein VF365_06170 [Candidatus Limnocylindria bacterium]